MGNGPGLQKYFKPCRKSMSEILLPDQIGPLSDKVNSTAIEEDKAEVTAVLVSASAYAISKFNTRTKGYYREVCHGAWHRQRNSLISG